MSSAKCGQCGLVNFLSAQHCKRCQASLDTPTTIEQSSSNPVAAPFPSLADPPKAIVPLYDKPRRALSPLRILIVVLLIIGAAWYKIDRDETARLAQAKADKEFNQQRRIEDDNAQRGRALSGRWSGPASTRP